MLLCASCTVAKAPSVPPAMSQCRYRRGAAYCCSRAEAASGRVDAAAKPRAPGTARGAARAAAGRTGGGRGAARAAVLATARETAEASAGVKRGAACRWMTRRSRFGEESRLLARERSAWTARGRGRARPRGARGRRTNASRTAEVSAARAVWIPTRNIVTVRGSVWLTRLETRSTCAGDPSWHPDAWSARRDSRRCCALAPARRPPRRTPGLATVHPGSSPAAVMSPAKHADAGCVEVVALQPVAVVDHLGRPVSSDFLRRNVAIGGHELGGSERVTPGELASLLSKLEADGTDTRIVTKAGGSAANTARGLSRGFGVRAGLLGAVGDDQWGNLFKQAMRDARVDVSNLSEKPGATGRCACFVEEGSGQRTMRTCMQDAVRLEAREILSRLGDAFQNPLRGASWVLVPGYAFYGAGLVDAAAAAAAEANCKVALALASFEIVRSFGTEIEALLRSGRVSAVFANEDEARELTKYAETSLKTKTKTRADDEKLFLDVKVATDSRTIKSDDSSPETAADRALDVLARWSPACVAVVTLGDKGCVAARGEFFRNEKGGTSERVACEAFEEIVAKDSTGAGDLFVSGFLYGLLRGAPLGECAELGCLAGAAATQSVGAEVSDEGWAWVRDRRPLLL